MLTTSSENSLMLSSAVLLSARLEQLGDDVAPNKWTSIRWSIGCWVKSPFGHQRNLNASRSSGATRIWWNIHSISADSATCPSRNLISTPTIELVKSGPVRSWSFRDVPLCFAAQSNTTRVFPGLFSTGWWGRYQSGLSCILISSSGTLLAWPMERYCSIVAL